MAGDVIKMVLQVDDKASGPVKKVGGATEKAGKQAKKAKTDYAQLAGKMVAFGLAAKAATASVRAMTQDLADSRNELADTATRTGITAETLAGLRLAAEGSGLTLGNLSGSLALFPKRMRDMQAGIGESKRAFEELGVSVMNADGSLRDADTVLKESLAAISLLPDATTQAAVATELFGRSGTALLQALSGTELQDFVDQAERFGIDIGPEAAKAAADWQREVAQLSLVSERAAAIVAESFGSKGSSKILKMAGAAVLTLAKLISDSFTMLGSMLGAFFDKFAARFSLIIDLGKAAAKAFTGDFEDASIAAGKAFDDLGGKLTQIAADVEPVTKRMLSGEWVTEAIKEGREFLKTETAGIGAGRGRVSAATVITPEESLAAKEDKEKAAKVPTAQELEDAMSASLRGASSSLKELEHLLYLLSPAGLAEGMVNKLSEPMKTMTEALGPAGGLVNSLSALGQMGSQAIVDGMKEAIRGVITALVEVVPDLIVEIPRMLMHLVPELVEGLVMAIPEILQALIIELPVAFFNGLMKWWRKIWETIQNFFMPGRKRRQERKERAEAVGGVQGAMIGSGGNPGELVGNLLRELFRGKKQTGAAHIDRTGLALVHQGEAIIPSNGANAQSVASRMGRGGGTNVTINTNVVDTNAIRGLGKLLEREFGSFGRSTSPVFNSPTGSRG